MFRFTIPNRGRLHASCMTLLNQFSLISIGQVRKRKLKCDMNLSGIECVMLRSVDISYRLYNNDVQIGITGSDYVLESGFKVIELMDLALCKGKLALLAPSNSSINCLDDLSEKKNLTIASQYPNYAKKLLSKFDAINKLIPITGSAEIYPYLGLSDLIIDIISTGETFLVNGLKVVHEFVNVSGRLYTNNESKNHYLVKEIFKILSLKIDKYRSV